jgi:hypothetical protein
MISISTGLKQALLTANLSVKKNRIGTDISFGDGDGAGGQDTINATSGLDIFTPHSHIHLLTPDGDPNRNNLVKVITTSAPKIEVAAGSLTALAAGGDIDLIWFDVAGCLRSIFQNCTIKIFSQNRAATADLAEPGTSICDMTLNGNAFVAGIPLNGLNFGVMDGDYLRRVIDPETAASEVWSGDPSSSSVANSYICYANDVVTGASVSSVRFNGTVSGAGEGGDMILANGNQLTAGVQTKVSSFKFQIKAADLT